MIWWLRRLCHNASTVAGAVGAPPKRPLVGCDGIIFVLDSRSHFRLCVERWLCCAGIIIVLLVLLISVQLFPCYDQRLCRINAAGCCVLQFVCLFVLCANHCACHDNYCDQRGLRDIKVPVSQPSNTEIILTLKVLVCQPSNTENIFSFSLRSRALFVFAYNCHTVGIFSIFSFATSIFGF